MNCWGGGPWYGYLISSEQLRSRGLLESSGAPGTVEGFGKTTLGEATTAFTERDQLPFGISAYSTRDVKKQISKQRSVPRDVPMLGRQLVRSWTCVASRGPSFTADLCLVLRDCPLAHILWQNFRFRTTLCIEFRTAVLSLSNEEDRSHSREPIMGPRP